MMMLTGGCRTLSHQTASFDFTGDTEIANPVVVPMADRWFVMDQVSDELDNYFPILRDERIGLLDGVMSEGWIETRPKTGATIFEPWRRDSTPGFERLHATLQTVRRFAKVRVIPANNSYLIDVKVYKELEDLETPVGSAVSGRGLRHDNALDFENSESWIGERNEGWIPMGRDFSLEQLILRNIQARLTQTPDETALPAEYQQ